MPGWADTLTDVMTWPRQRTAVPTGTCRLLGACVQPFHDPIRGYGVRVLLRWYRIELFRSSILYRQRLYADAETLTLRVRVGGQMSICCAVLPWTKLTSCVQRWWHDSGQRSALRRAAAWRGELTCDCMDYGRM